MPTVAPPPESTRAMRAPHPQESLELHLLLADLQDERAQARRREGLWISLVIHLAGFIVIMFLPRFLPRPALVISTSDMLRDKQLTYLDLSPDAQKPVPAPKTNIISDKNRIATARTPVVDRQTLEELRARSRQGPPGLSGPRPQPAPPQPQAAAQPPSRGEDTPPPEPSPAKTESDLPTPVTSRNNGRGFGSGIPLSAKSAIEEAARASASSRAGDGGVGVGGDYGLGGARPNSGIKSQVDVLSDTRGVDFGPYLQRVLHDVRVNWYNLIPEVARPPLMKQGKVGIEFVILKDGSVSGMKLVYPSGDVSLDRAAWGGITGSNPFPPLPEDFRGNYLALRFHFFYNPSDNQLK